MGEAKKREIDDSVSIKETLSTSVYANMMIQKPGMFLSHEKCQALFSFFFLLWVEK